MNGGYFEHYISVLYMGEFLPLMVYRDVLHFLVGWTLIIGVYVS